MSTLPTMLDSSPIAPPRLKRSASVASLPTPPRTRHKRRRAASKHSRDSDDGLSATTTDESDGEATVEKLTKEAEAEEAFWGATNPPDPASRPLLYKRLEQAQSKSQVSSSSGSSQTGLGLPPVSPPPSHRKAPVKKTVPPALRRTQSTPRSTGSSAVSPPCTPPPKRRSALPRDSPNNPFLASPLGAQEEVFAEADTEPTLPEEKPTMAFVFRGVRREFPNPYYDEDKSASGPTPNSLLPPEHPDFEPDERGVRKLLFGVRRKKPASSKSASDRRRAAGEARERQSRKNAVQRPKLNLKSGEETD